MILGDNTICKEGKREKGESWGPPEMEKKN